MLTQEEVRKRFQYIPDGSLLWREPISTKVESGEIAGYRRKDGYYIVCLNSKKYLAHRVIFLYHHGYLPDLIDHINRNNQDNRIENLRESNKSLNFLNSGISSNNKSGVRGVSWCKIKKKWVVRFKQDGKYLHLGYFKSIDEATKIRKLKEESYEISCYR